MPNEIIESLRSDLATPRRAGAISKATMTHFDTTTGTRHSGAAASGNCERAISPQRKRSVRRLSPRHEMHRGQRK